MSTRSFGGRGVGFSIVRHGMIVLWVGAGVMLLTESAMGQGPGSAVPVVASKPWQPARLPDGQPDVQGGMWQAVVAGTGRLDNPIPTNIRFQNPDAPARTRPSRIVDPPDGRVPYQPWAAARKKQQEFDLEHPTRLEHLDTQHRCLTSTPRLYYFAQFRIIQIPGSIVFAWDGYHQYRVIPVDGSPHIGSDIKLWMGDGRGRWEGNTLIVDTTNLNGKSRLTSSGDFHSDKVHLTERFTFVDADTMTYEVTLDDPAVFTRPWTMRIAQKRDADEEMWENACHEGERLDQDERLLLPQPGAGDRK